MPGATGPRDAERSEAQQPAQIWMTYETKRTTDHDTIREWAERRAGVPATMRDDDSDDEVGGLRIDFADGTGDEALEYISWDDWFEKFDEENLCFLYQEQRASGEDSSFFRLISR
jgi:hypothetical protein